MRENLIKFDMVYYKKKNYVSKVSMISVSSNLFSSFFSKTLYCANLLTKVFPIFG